MKTLSREEKQKTLDSFLEDVKPELAVVDRSTIQAWGDCPWMAKEIESGRAGPVGLPAEAGEAIHAALSAATQAWIDSNGNSSATDIRNDLEIELRRVRPDLQPEAIRGAMPSAWAWSKFLESIHPGNILRFDGGEEHRCGQLALDIPDLGARVTSELDLLYSSPSPEVLEEVDYKTGHKQHWVSDVADALQFQLHACLVFENYPAVNALRVRVWDTRFNRQTYAVVFSRNRMHDYLVRIRRSLEIRIEQWNDPQTWPLPEKCGMCQVASRCPVAGYPIAETPEQVLRDLIAVEAKADALRARLVAHVDATGRDVRCGSVSFGRNKPASGRKAPATLYEAKE